MREQANEASKEVYGQLYLPSGVLRAQGTHLGEELCLLLPTGLAGVTFSADWLCVALCLMPQKRDFYWAGEPGWAFAPLWPRDPLQQEHGQAGLSGDSFTGWLRCDVLAI